MIGAILGDILGSVYEFGPEKDISKIKFSERSDFTDDTVLTIAVADAILTGKEFRDNLHLFGNKYPGRGYGGRFVQWLKADGAGAYNSYGNGSAMRASPVGWVARTEAEVLDVAEKTANVTHDHPEGIKGAQAIALAVFLARNGSDKEIIREKIAETFAYDLEQQYNDIQPGYFFDVTCQGSVPQAIIAFLDSNDYQSAIRKAVALGGDADTQACMAGAIAEAFYGIIPDSDCKYLDRLPDEFLFTIRQFYTSFDIAMPCGIK
ncbi:ADP-ribosyl-[dinitrogen reductase] hydrolase [Salinivirga cyanobacteriivorans]|uniref:ADP-ribosyl-[dinitrogen reductase] hydrolase n=1 Tax=Salinivirga cyanobacteriivorans TaxID=1307839 RepID=A0A0S2I478_9BACT|nr:ADP-ribosylglycohydrolase family protein [Salinivirga cyanobacteriivorans]ALO17151.1 ADP-ribosyl-[dinitrogen reductase] hydrolase [Salinivirga cyanobacteriivorans]